MQGYASRMRKLVWPVRRLATLFFEGTQCGRVPDPQIVPALWAVPATVPRIALMVRGKLPVRLRRTARTVGRSIGTATSTTGWLTELSS